MAPISNLFSKPMSSAWLTIILFVSLQKAFWLICNQSIWPLCPFITWQLVSLSHLAHAVVFSKIAADDQMVELLAFCHPGGYHYEPLLVGAYHLSFLLSSSQAFSRWLIDAVTFYTVVISAIFPEVLLSQKEHFCTQKSKRIPFCQ